MKSEEIIKLLEFVPHSISHIERDLGMPKTVLQKAIKGYRGLPKRWSLALKAYVETKQYLLSGAISHISPSKREVVEQVVKEPTPKEEKSTKTIVPKKDDPKEGSMAFHLKYGAFTYAEAEKLKNTQE
jgi:hypothetical protein